MDDWVDRQDGYKIVSKNQLHRVADWRLLHDGSAFKALKNWDLRPNDVRLITAFTIMLVFLIALIVALLIVSEGPTGAIATSPLWYVGVCLVIGASVINQSRAFTTRERVVWVVFTLLYLV